MKDKVCAVDCHWEVQVAGINISSDLCHISHFNLENSIKHLAETIPSSKSRSSSWLSCRDGSYPRSLLCIHQRFGELLPLNQPVFGGSVSKLSLKVGYPLNPMLQNHHFPQLFNVESLGIPSSCANSITSASSGEPCSRARKSCWAKSQLTMQAGIPASQLPPVWWAYNKL